MHVFELFLVFIFASTIGYLFSDYIIQKKAKRWHHIGIKKGYHVHHSVYGLATFFFIPITIQNAFETVCFVGFGVGIIVEHTLHDGFVFISRVHKTLE